MTGAWCPGCGSLRAVNDLTHGDVLAAASSNLVLVLALPVLALLWVGLALLPIALIVFAIMTKMGLGNARH